MLLKKISKEERERLVRVVQAYFLDERDEELGTIAAEEHLQFFIQLVGPFLYNLALHDVKSVIQEKFLQMEDELYVLEKPTHTSR